MSNQPFSHSILIADVPAAGRDYSIHADADEREKLAETLRIPEVRAVAADLTVRPVRAGGYSVRGEVRGEVVQSCVVTLEPVVQQVAEEIDLILMRAEDLDLPKRERDALVDAVETEGPEIFERGRIDLGVIAAEHLALGLDPYPRKPGVAFESHMEDKAEEKESPFAALARLRTSGE